MTDQKRNATTEERVRMGQSVAQGDTGDGNTGVPEFEQGISNRPGDADEAQANAGMREDGVSQGAGDSGGETDDLKDRQARGNRGPEKQKGFGQGG